MVSFYFLNIAFKNSKPLQNQIASATKNEIFHIYFL